MKITWGNENIFPTACAWHPSGDYALIGTSAMTGDEGETALYKFDGRSMTVLAKLGGSGVSCIAWSHEGLALGPDLPVDQGLLRLTCTVCSS